MSHYHIIDYHFIFEYSGSSMSVVFPLCYIHIVRISISKLSQLFGNKCIAVNIDYAEK